jgi:hypothetical protein
MILRIITEKKSMGICGSNIQRVNILLKNKKLSSDYQDAGK